MDLTAAGVDRFLLSSSGMRFGLLILLVYLVLAQSAFGQVVNMFAGRERGGFGDLASNLVMAQQLLALRPELKIQMWVGEREMERMRILLPSLDPTLPYQNVQGIDFYSYRNRQLPRGDVFLAFSVKIADLSANMYAKDFHLPQELTDQTANETINRIANAPVIFKFLEYSGATHEVSGVYRPTGKFIEIHAETGPGAAGLYAVPIAHNKSAEETREVEAGFGYSTYAFSTLAYVKSVLGLASSNPQKRYRIHIRPFPELQMLADALIATPNLEVVTSANMDFETTKKLIQSATIPILVTGDVSLSLAIQHHKPFIYELHRWKKGLAKSVQTQLSSAAINENELAELAAALHLPANEAFQGEVQDVPAFYRLLIDAKFQSRIATRLATLTAEKSLPVRTLEMIDAVTEATERTPKAVRQALADQSVRFKPSIIEKIGDAIGECIQLLSWGL